MMKKIGGIRMKQVNKIYCINIFQLVQFLKKNLIFIQAAVI